jgi:hypothetical protein
MTACIGTPISWLRLERYAAGELSADERSQIASHLETCEACAASMRSIADDERALPPLPAPKKGVVVALRRYSPIVGALAVAAGVLAVLRAPDTKPPSERIKGSDVSFALVRDDDGTAIDAGGLYRDGDRWKALVTCPPGMRATFDVVVYERGQPAYPLAPATDLACGNAIAIPGAFRTTGRERLLVCLVWNEERATLAGGPPARSRCATLDPAP